MILLSPFNPAARLRGLLVLLLLTLGLLAGVSLSQLRQIEVQHAVIDTAAMPALKQVHELTGQIDELRGMAALHLLLRSDGERTALEARLQAGRRQVELRMQAYGKRLVDDTDRQHHQAVQSALADFWLAQDRLLAASRRAPIDAAAAAQARALLKGESQQAYARLSAELDAWWTYTEQWAARAARKARAAAQAAMLLAGLGMAAAGSALLLLLLQARAARRQRLAGGRAIDLQAPAAASAAADRPAWQQHLQTLNAAVAAARRGEPGRAAGLSAQEAQRLADEVDAATRGLRALIEHSDAETRR